VDSGGQTLKTVKCECGKVCGEVQSGVLSLWLEPELSPSPRSSVSTWLDGLTLMVACCSTPIAERPGIPVLLSEINSIRYWKGSDSREQVFTPSATEMPPIVCNKAKMSRLWRRVSDTVMRALRYEFMPTQQSTVDANSATKWGTVSRLLELS